MDAIIGRLCQPGGPGLSGGLIDSEVFFLLFLIFFFWFRFVFFFFFFSFLIGLFVSVICRAKICSN